MSTPVRPPCAPALLAAALVALACTGCVTRTLSVRSEPAGARVILDGKAVGTTPYTEVFYSYGTRALDLELAGHARRHELLVLELPWWQYFPLDIVTDLLQPFPIHDDHVFDFTLTPVDPEAGTWEDARAAYARERALRTQGASGASSTSDASDASDAADADPP